MALTANFIADFSSFTDATKDAVRAMQGFKESALEMGPATDRSLEERQKQAEQVGRAIKRVADDALEAAKGFIAAYSEEQDAVQRLTSALDNSTDTGVDVIQTYQDMASEFQKTTEYADDAIINVQAVMTTIGQVGPEQMGLALTATTNLAAALKIDLDTAANLVAKSLAAMAAGGGPLAKVKAAMGDAYVEGMSAKDMFNAINTATGPAAQERLNTYSGQMEHLKNTMGDADEQAGKLLVETLTKVNSAFVALPASVQTFTLVVGRIGSAILPTLVSLGALVTAIGATGLGAAVASAAGSFALFVAGIGSAYLALKGLEAFWTFVTNQIIGLAKRLYEGVAHWLGDMFSGLVEIMRAKLAALVSYFAVAHGAIVGGSIVPDLISGIGAQFARLDALMVDPVRDATRDATRAFASLGGPSVSGLNVGALAGGGGAAGGTVINISMSGMLGANDPQTRQAITQVVGDALAQAMRGQRLLSSA